MWRCRSDAGCQLGQEGINAGANLTGLDVQLGPSLRLGSDRAAKLGALWRLHNASTDVRSASSTFALLPLGPLHQLGYIGPVAGGRDRTRTTS